MAVEQGWAIKAPWGPIWEDSVARKRDKAITRFLREEDADWEWWYRRGWRAVRVLITDELWRMNEQEAGDV